MKCDENMGMLLIFNRLSTFRIFSSRLKPILNLVNIRIGKWIIQTKVIAFWVNFTIQLESSQSNIRRESYDKNTKANAVRIFLATIMAPRRQHSVLVAPRHLLGASRVYFLLVLKSMKILLLTQTRMQL